MGSFRLFCEARVTTRNDLQNFIDAKRGGRLDREDFYDGESHAAFRMSGGKLYGNDLLVSMDEFVNRAEKLVKSYHADGNNPIPENEAKKLKTFFVVHLVPVGRNSSGGHDRKIKIKSVSLYVFGPDKKKFFGGYVQSEKKILINLYTRDSAGSGSLRNTIAHELIHTFSDKWYDKESENYFSPHSHPEKSWLDYRNQKIEVPAFRGGAAYDFGRDVGSYGDRRERKSFIGSVDPIHTDAGERRKYLKDAGKVAASFTPDDEMSMRRGGSVGDLDKQYTAWNRRNMWNSGNPVNPEMGINPNYPALDRKRHALLRNRHPNENV